MRAGNGLTSAFLEHHPDDAARVLEQLAVAAGADLLQAIPVALAIPILERMLPSYAAVRLTAMEPHDAAQRLERMSAPAGARVLRALDSTQAEALLAQLGKEVRARLTLLLHYPEECAGALMDPAGLLLPDDVTVAEAVRRIEQTHVPVACHVYVVDRRNRLIGVVAAGDLLQQRRSMPLRKALRRSAASVPTHAHVGKLRDHPAWERFRTLPVVDREATVQGVLHYDTVQEAYHDTGRTPGGDGVLHTALTVAGLFWIAALQLLKVGLDLGLRRPGTH